MKPFNMGDKVYFTLVDGFNIIIEEGEIISIYYNESSDGISIVSMCINYGEDRHKNGHRHRYNHRISMSTDKVSHDIKDLLQTFCTGSIYMYKGEQVYPMKAGTIKATK